MKQYTKLKKCSVKTLKTGLGVFGLRLVVRFPLPRLGFLRGVFLAYHLASWQVLTT